MFKSKRFGRTRFDTLISGPILNPQLHLYVGSMVEVEFVFKAGVKVREIFCPFLEGQYHYL